MISLRSGNECQGSKILRERFWYLKGQVVFLFRSVMIVKLGEGFRQWLRCEDARGIFCNCLMNIRNIIKPGYNT